MWQSCMTRSSSSGLPLSFSTPTPQRLKANGVLPGHPRSEDINKHVEPFEAEPMASTLGCLVLRGEHTQEQKALPGPSDNKKTAGSASITGAGAQMC